MLVAAYAERRFDSVVSSRAGFLRLRSRPAPALDISALQSLQTPTTTRCQQFRAIFRAVALLREACTILWGDFNCCAAGEGRMDLQIGSIQSDVSLEAEAVGTIFDAFHEVILSGFSRIACRCAEPPAAH